jgi:hypothetical protein
MNNNNKKAVSFIIKNSGPVSLFIGSESFTIALDHPNYDKILAALKTGEHDKLENLVNVGKAVQSYGKGVVTVKNGQVFYADQPLHNGITTRILKMMSEGFKVDYMFKFLENLMANPSFRAVNETYTFLENEGLPITEDGCFLGYKAVRNNYTDKRTGKFDNSVGQVVKMLRNQVDENYHQDCSYGLHVGSLGYVEQFAGFARGQACSENGDRLLIVKVNPKDVVSVPEYAGHTKMRVCEYVVVDEIKDIVAELDKASVYKADATPSVPDACDCDGFGCGFDTFGEYEDEDDYSSSNETPEIDTTSPWNAEAYVRGFADGEHDLDNGEDYGWNRDYTEENSYRIGYNDAYNGRPNQAREVEEASAGYNSHDDEDYNAGIALGRYDKRNGLTFQSSLSLFEGDAFVDGYEEGYNE